MKMKMKMNSLSDDIVCPGMTRSQCCDKPILIEEFNYIIICSECKKDCVSWCYNCKFSDDVICPLEG